jgi:hypothetical protein
VIAQQDLGQTHDWDGNADVGPDPHSSGYRCRKCQITICKFCRPQDNDDFDSATEPCPGKPWYD